MVHWLSPVGCLAVRCSYTRLLGISRVEAADPALLEAPVCELAGETIRQLGEYFEGRRREFSLPVEQEGTAFEQSVWRELCNVPYGSRISYRELAERIGKPRAYRAVGNANGRNRLCIIVPCHRIIRSDGATGGYAYGPQMKEYLLELERKA